MIKAIGLIGAVAIWGSYECSNTYCGGPAGFP
jgi:hypothetical protein